MNQINSDLLADYLSVTGALKIGDFTLSSGVYSPYYLDLRLLPSYPLIFDRICDLYIDIMTEKGLDYDLICGVPTAGLSFSAVIANRLLRPLIYVRSQKKSYGTGRKIEGIFAPGMRVLLIDDLITSGGSIIAIATALREDECHVENVLVLIDRLQGGKENLAAERLQLSAVIDIVQLITAIYRQVESGKSNLMTKEEYHKIMEYIGKQNG
ncbi:orotate phosphoribosyltransferase [Candidatus Acetothermia bacterium]|jgi:orotate phosphoribosyltransferase|nr:orotate phosphoribosyltransferase [Candidatus Acetothermia bacterium]MCI2426973.1 orotate phosphoribosyltransferase [Candidatus Acetothermia bacterium]